MLLLCLVLASGAGKGEVPAVGQIAPAPQLFQVNVADAQDELEANFGIPFFVLIGFSGSFAILVTHYGSGYGLCCVPASVFHGRITFFCSPASNGALAYQVISR